MNCVELNQYLSKKYSHSSSFFVGLVMILSDFIALLFSIAIGFFIVNIFVSDNIHFRTFINYSLYLPLFLLAFGAMGLYPAIMMPPTEQIRKTFFCSLFGFSGICLSIVAFNYNGFSLAKDFFITYSTNTALCCALLISVPVSTVFVTLFREFFKHFYFRKQRRVIPTIVYCYDIESAYLIERLISSNYLGYAPAVIISSDSEIQNRFPDIPVYSSDQEIFSVIKELNIKVAVLLGYDVNKTSEFFTNYRYVLSFDKSRFALSNTMQIKDMAGILGFATTNRLSFKTNLFIKRFIELFLVIISSPFWLTIFIVLFIGVKLTSPGPAIYVHKRIGKNGTVLKCLKFRSMYKNADEMLEKILAENEEMRKEWETDRKILNDPRVTSFGKFLRKTSLDELPQLFNVLFGNMSLIGPRPVTESELVYYGKYSDFVFSVKPGISGMWQVSGRSDTGYEERVNFDTYYIQNWSIWLDIWILIRTVGVVLSHKGAY
ncbi:MAG: exopolysaccharide biosynthesis polyprenyl glycosylphosphotransferase [Treponema sp.]|nr:exopolysaccharide biosynthesis polyprenyl glycosylphosphotransferase [Candidatus Treponema caballi]